MARGVSTVVDVAVCLLLVGVAVATLAGGVPSAESGASDADADAVATTLATATVAVPTNGRTAHDTYAGHLTAAAVTNADLDGDSLVEGGYSDSVTREVAATTDEQVFVTAAWEPYPGTPLEGRLAAGQRPPNSAEVAATTLTVDSGLAEPTAEPKGFDELAETLASTYVDWLFPPERTYARLGDSRTALRTATRYRTVADTFEVDLEGTIADAEVRRANDALAAGLAERLEADLRSRYETPEEAAADVAVDEVEIVVRRWQP